MLDTYYFIANYSYIYIFSKKTKSRKIFHLLFIEQNRP